MGIRESLEKAPKEENLKDFVMPEEEPENELEFDVEKEIPKSNIENMLYDSFNMERDISYSNGFERSLKMFEALALALPNLELVSPDGKSSINDEDFMDHIWDDEKGDYNEEFVSGTWPGLKREIEARINTNKKYQENRDNPDYDYLYNELSSWLEITDLLVGAKILFPNDFLSFSQELNIDQFWDEIKSGLEEKRGQKLSEDFLALAANIRILFPKHFSEIDLKETKINFTEKTQETMKQFDNPLQFLYYFKILFPEAFPDISFVKPLFLKEKKGFLKYLKESPRDYGIYDEYACEMVKYFAVITHDVEITEEKFSLVMPEKKSFQQEKQKRPERREY